MIVASQEEKQADRHGGFIGLHSELHISGVRSSGYRWGAGGGGEIEVKHGRHGGPKLRQA